MKTYYVYMLECSNGAFYTGYTTDMKRRYREHQEGSSKCKYTRSFPPKRIGVCLELTGELSLALKLEKSIKQLTRTKKLAIVENENELKEWIKSFDMCSAIKSVNSY